MVVVWYQGNRMISADQWNNLALEDAGMSVTFSLSQLLAVTAPILIQSSNLPWPDFSGVPLDFHAVISPARGTVCGFCCRVGWRSGNKPSALLFRSGLPGTVSVVCRSEELSSLRGVGRGCWLFFQPSELPLSFPETQGVLGSFVL